MEHTHVACTFLQQDAYEQAAPLNVEPTPDVVNRIFMVFRGLKEDDYWSAEWEGARIKSLEEDVSFWRQVVGGDFEGAGNPGLFRVLEWGGMEVF